MDKKLIDKAASELITVRESRERLKAITEDCRPTTTDVAYQIQDVVVKNFLNNSKDGTVVGYKVGCTNPEAQRQLGLRAPFRGVLVSPFVYDSPAEIRCSDGFMRMIEPEVCFRLGSDLPASGCPYNANSVQSAIAGVMPAVEVVDSRFLDWTTAGGPQLIADNACTGFWVKGEEIRDFGRFNFSDHTSRLIRNGVPSEKGNTSNVLGHPLNVLSWLANHLGEWDLPLSAGHLVTTGTTTVVNPASLGDEIVADFGTLGSVNVRFI